MADSKVSELTSAGALTGAELVYVVRFGDATPDRKTNVQAIANLNRPWIVPVKSISDTYALVVDDAGYLVRSTGSLPISVGISLSNIAPFEIGTVISIRQAGTGQVTIGSAAGVALFIPVGRQAKTRAAGSTVMLHKVGSDGWDLTGDLASS